MSLQLVCELSNEIETIVDADRNLWFKTADLGKYLGIRNIRYNFKDFPSGYTHPRPFSCSLNECAMSTRNAIRPRTKDQENEWDIFLSRRGLLYVINKCRKPTPDLINLTGCLGTELYKNKWLCKEQDTQIMQALNGEEMIYQFSVRKYRTDLYFPRYKLATECNEFDHCDRDIEYEIEQQKH